MRRFLVILAALALIAPAFADQPGPVNSGIHHGVQVKFLPYGVTWVQDTLVAMDSAKCGWIDTVTIQVPVGAEYKGIYIVPDSLGGLTDSLNITARAIGRIDFLAYSPGSAMQNIPLVDGNGSPQVWLDWTPKCEYQSWVPDSVTTVEEFRPGACEAIQFVIRSGLVNADTVFYIFGVNFRHGGGMR